MIAVPSSIMRQVVLRVVLVCIQITIIYVIIFRIVPVPFTPLMAIRKIENSKPDWELRHHWVPLNKINTWLQLGVITSEDPKFFKHIGFDFESLQEVAVQGLEQGKFKRGGSTISQQTAKNLFLWPARSYVRKAMEVPLTILLEMCWNKKRIIEVYLNSIETGDGIFGMDAACQYYFYKPALNISEIQAFRLASILPNPRKFTPKSSDERVQKHAQWIKRNYPYIDKKAFYWWN